jgi:hypothetical protein
MGKTPVTSPEIEFGGAANSANRESRDIAPITVVLNWQAGLKK